jgi:O-antigen/teichoic acid export membrane protein
MIKMITQTFKSFFSEGHERTLAVKKNAVLTLFLKGASILFGLIMVPMTIEYVNPLQYGIWLTLSSVIVWFSILDIGLGNGLKNKLAEAVARNDIKLAREYISTGYTMLAVISLVLVGLYMVLKPFLNWSTILHAPLSLNQELNVLAFYLVLLFALQFVLQLVNIVFFALQQTAKAAMVTFVGSIFSLIMLFILKATTHGSLLYLGLTLFFGSLLSMALFSCHFFYFDRRDLKPSFRFFKLKHVKPLLNVGVKFFVIQLSFIVHFQSTNFIISRYFSPLEVTQYNIPFRLFSACQLVFNVALTPLWTSVTEAYTQKDYSWIIDTERKLLMLWRYIFVFSVFVLLFSNIIYGIWLNHKVDVPFVNSFGIMLYIMTMTYGSIYVVILNGIGAIQQQFKLGIISMILFFPLTYLIAIILKLGVPGISIALIISNLNGLIFAPLQYKKLTVRWTKPNYQSRLN